MIRIQTVTAKHAMLLKSTRLRALQDTPAAFGSTFAREAAFTDQQWLDRAIQWSNGTTSTGFLAMQNGKSHGIAAAYFAPDDLARANLVSMWIAPKHRRRGVGRLLVNEVIAWSRSRSAKSVQLDVVNTNQNAIRFYQSIGFALNGVTKPYPNDPALFEYEMSLQL